MQNKTDITQMHHRKEQRICTWDRDLHLRKTRMDKAPNLEKAMAATPVLLPGKSHGQKSLVGCSPWGRKESDTTERLHFHFSLFMHWRRKRQPTPVFLCGESQGQGNLVGCRLWGCTESDKTEAT